jgi:hypothetical protein
MYARSLSNESIIPRVPREPVIENQQAELKSCPPLGSARTLPEPARKRGSQANSPECSPEFTATPGNLDQQSKHYFVANKGIYHALQLAETRYADLLINRFRVQVPAGALRLIRIFGEKWTSSSELTPH